MTKWKLNWTERKESKDILEKLIKMEDEITKWSERRKIRKKDEFDRIKWRWTEQEGNVARLKA